MSTGYNYSGPLEKEQESCASCRIPKALEELQTCLKCGERVCIDQRFCLHSQTCSDPNKA